MNMKSRFILFFLPFFLIACSTSRHSVDKTSTNTIPTGEWEPIEKSLLWQIDKKGYKKSYVFGTIHIIDAEAYFLPPGTESAIKESDKIVYEISMDEMQDISAQMGMLTKAFMKDNVRLSDLLEDDEYEMVADHFEQMGMPMVFLDRIKPMFLTILAGEDMNPTMLQDGSMLSYEMELDKIASNAGLEKGGLESIAYQMEIFDKIPYKDQADMLVEAIEQVGKSDNETLEFFTLMYTSQDLKRMHDFTITEEGGMQDYSDILLYDRNSNWIPLMDEMMKKKSVFFAVGAGHLGGKKGVLALLKKQGFEVTPVKGDL